MKTQIIALEAHDDFISVRDRMSWAKSPRILLVWPRFEKITLRAVDLRILQKHAYYLGADMGVITRRGDVRRDAERFGIPVFKSAAAAQRDEWPRRQSSAARFPRGARGERVDLAAMKEAGSVREAGWRSGPVARIAFFSLGVIAVLAIAAVFLPQATVTLAPISQQQSITLPVTASPSISAVSITGSLPAQEITVTASGEQSARVATESSIPDGKAHGIAKFKNLTQSDVTIPAGTVVYSLSPAAAQFATLNNTHLPGNVNAVVEVPISSVSGGAIGNVPANSILAIEGNLGLSASVTNPEPTSGGTDRITAAPSEADRKRLHDALLDVLKAGAQAQMSSSIGSKDMLLLNTLKLGQIQEETYDPPAGKGGNLLKLTLRADFGAEYLKADDLTQLAEGILNASRPDGFAPVADSMAFRLQGAPVQEAGGVIHFGLQIEQKLAHEVDLAHANALVRGLSPRAAQEVLKSQLKLAEAPEIRMSPSWWPWLPLIPFRITVVGG